MVNATSSAVTGSPSCQRASLLSTKSRSSPMVDRPALGEVRDDRPRRAIPDEPREHQRDQVAVGLGPGRERADRDRAAEDALAIRSGSRRAGPGVGEGRRGGAGQDGRDPDKARDQGEQDDEGPDDERISTGHRAPCERSVAADRRDPGSGCGDRGEDERRQREDDEQDEEDDRELPQPAFDAPAAAIDGRIAAEGPRQADTRACSRIAMMSAMLTRIWPMARSGFTT